MNIRIFNKMKGLLLLSAALLGGVNIAFADDLTIIDGYYQIGSAADWAAFVDLHNNGVKGQNLNAVLTADIVVEGNAMVGINGTGKPYRGIFDGQGHKLTINYNLDEERVAPFRRINGATIRNLNVEGTITTTSKLAAGIVGGLWQNGSTIENCIANVTINDTNSGDATHGGICGSFEDVNGANTIQNCAFIGAINAPNRNGCGGIVGWTNNNDNNNIIRNCYVSATMNVKKDDNNDIICRNNGNVENCYYTIDITGLKNNKIAVYATSDQITSGEFAYKLNGNNDAGAWHQKLTDPKDAYPVPFGTAETLVYANGELNCDGTPKGSTVYGNVEGSTPQDDHTFANGFCTKCDTYQPGFMTDNGSGIYEIETKYQMKWFSCLVNNENASANGQLMKDIDMAGITGYTPIGQAGHDKDTASRTSTSRAMPYIASKDCLLKPKKELSLRTSSWMPPAPSRVLIM